MKGMLKGYLSSQVSLFISYFLRLGECFVNGLSLVLLLSSLTSFFMHLFPMLFVGQQRFVFYSSSLLRLSFCLEGIIFSQSTMLQLDKFTYFTQFFWSCPFFFTFAIIYLMDRYRPRKLSSLSPSTSASSSTDPENEKDRERCRTLYRGHWVEELKAQSKGLVPPQEIRSSQWASALYKIVPKEGEIGVAISELLAEVQKEGTNSAIFNRVLEEVVKCKK
jgi:hypothetical protein